MPKSLLVRALRDSAADFLHCDRSEVTLIFQRTELEDSTQIISLGLTDDSFIIALKKTPEEAKADEKNTSENRAPPTIDKNGRPIPSNIESLVKFIVDLQFTETQARAALEFSGYDLRSAVMLLAKGTTLGADGQPQQPPEADNTRNPDSNTAFENEDPEIRMITVRNEEQRKIDEELKAFTDEQRMAVQRLANRHHNMTTVLQVYLACDKDEHATASCLATME